jgi:hypothetical protein
VKSQCAPAHGRQSDRPIPGHPHMVLQTRRGCLICFEPRKTLTWLAFLSESELLLTAIEKIACSRPAHIAIRRSPISSLAYGSQTHPLGYSGVGIILPSSPSLIAHRPRALVPGLVRPLKRTVRALKWQSGGDLMGEPHGPTSRLAIAFGIAVGRSSPPQET